MCKLNKTMLLCVALAFTFAGCGKKKSMDVLDKSKTSTKKIAQSDYKENTENLLEDSDISEFAFVDNETLDTKEKSTGGLKVLADNDDLEIDNDFIERDEESSLAFKPVHFDFNKNSIRLDQKAVVSENIALAKNAVKQGRTVVVEGHCDQIGSATYNLALSQRRAEAVKSEVIKSGIAQNNIKTIGYGYERPLVWSDAKDRTALIHELAPNRRAEIITN